MRTGRYAVLAVLVATILFGTWPLNGGAEDAEGCAGLGDYREAMIEAWPGGGEVSADPETDDRDPMTFSSDEWLAIADGVLEYQRILKEIDPPDFAAAWHQVRIEMAGLVEQSARAVAKDGLFAMIAFTEPIEAVEAKEAEAVAAGTAICADFDDFVREFGALGGPDNSSPEPARATPDEVPFGDSATVGDQWTVQVLTVFADAHEIDPADDFFNDWVDTYELPEGQQYFPLRVRITNGGATAGDPTSDLRFAVVSETDFEYAGLFACGSIPGGLAYGSQMDAGETIEANLCWVVREEHVPSLHLTVQPASSFGDADAVRFELSGASAASAPEPTLEPTPEPESTGADLQTRVAELEATAEARGDKINAQRTKIADFEAQLADAGDATVTPASADDPFGLDGENESGEAFREAVEFEEGEYEVAAACANTAMQVYVFEVGDDPNDLELVTHPVSRSRLDEPSTVAEIPRTDTFLVEIWCDGVWSVEFRRR